MPWCYARGSCLAWALWLPSLLTHPGLPTCFLREEKDQATTWQHLGRTYSSVGRGMIQAGKGYYPGQFPQVESAFKSFGMSVKIHFRRSQVGPESLHF